MAKKSKPAPMGDNSGLTDEEKAALQLHFTLKIRAAEAEADQAKAVHAGKLKAVNSLFALVKGELQINRKEFEEVLAADLMTEAEFIAKEKARSARFALQGLPVGTQLNMFERGDTADDKALAHADGLRAGRRADDAVPPKHISPAFHPDWMEGWHAGQKENGEKLIRASEILAARSLKSGKLEAEEPTADVDDEDGLDADLVGAEAGWVKPTAEEAAFA